MKAPFRQAPVWALMLIVLAVGGGYLACRPSPDGAKPGPALDTPDDKSETLLGDTTSLPLTGPTASNRQLAADSNKGTAPTELQSRTTLHVQDKDHAPVRDAQVFAALNGKWNLIGTTGERGEIALELPSTLRVCATHENFCTVEKLLMSEDPAPTITLEAGGVIEGRVAGKSLPDDISIIVHEDFGRFPLDAVQESFRGHPLFRKWPVREDGSFRISGLAPEIHWRVQAISKSALSELEVRVPGTVEAPAWVEFTMRPVWIAEFVFVDSSGAPLHYSKTLDLWDSHPAREFQLRKPKGLAYPSFYAAQFLLPREESVMSLEDGELHYSMLFTGAAGRAKGAAIPFSIQLPGYELLEDEVTIKRLGADGPADVFSLRTEVTSWGDLRVEFTGLDYLANTPIAANQSPDFQVRLVGDEFVFAYGLRAPLNRELTLHGIPNGTYDASFVLTGGFMNLQGSPARVTIGESSASTRFDLAGMGSVRFHLPEELFPKPPTRLVLTLVSHQGMKEKDGIKAYVTKDYMVPGPPYVLRHVPPGLYRVRLNVPVQGFHRDPRAVPQDTILISESYTLDVELRPELAGQVSPGVPSGR